MSTATSVPYTDQGAMHDPLRVRIDAWNLKRQIDAANVALDVLTSPAVVARCNDQGYQAILGGYVVKTSLWTSQLYTQLERASVFDDPEINAAAREVHKRAYDIVSKRYADELPHELEDFAQCHASAHAADGNGRFGKRQGWFIRNRMGDALSELQAYGVPVNILP